MDDECDCWIVAFIRITGRHKRKRCVNEFRLSPFSKIRTLDIIIIIIIIIRRGGFDSHTEKGRQIRKGWIVCIFERYQR